MTLTPVDLAWIKKNVALAPLPTPEQRDRLVTFLVCGTCRTRNCRHTRPATSTASVPYHSPASDAAPDQRAGHLYVVEFESGVIKVGREVSLGTRVRLHSKDAPVARVWESDRIADVEAAEKALIAQVGQIGHRLRPSREYFTNVTFEQVVEIAGLNSHP